MPSAEMFVVIAFSQIIFVNRSTITTIAFIPLDLGRGPMILMLISYHGLYGILMNVIFLISSNAEFYSVGIWSNLAYISWHLSLDLATNNSIWVVPLFFAVLNVPHLLRSQFSCKIFFFNFLLFRMYILSSIYTILSCSYDNPSSFSSA